MHPVIEAAGRRAELPPWAQLTAERRAHVERVADLLSEWADTLGLPEEERIRWLAAGRLHDALKDAPIAEMREFVGEGAWPDALLHAPAAAGRLARDGVDDEPLLLAIAYHSVGHPAFGDLGEHLYLADYLEPGRPDGAERDELQRAMPGERGRVLPQVIRRRLERELEAGHPILPAALGFWNRVVET